MFIVYCKLRVCWRRLFLICHGSARKADITLLITRTKLHILVSIAVIFFISFFDKLWISIEFLDIRILSMSYRSTSGVIVIILSSHKVSTRNFVWFTIYQTVWMMITSPLSPVRRCTGRSSRWPAWATGTSRPPPGSASWSGPPVPSAVLCAIL